MTLEDKHLMRLQALYKEHFIKEINKKEAYEHGIKLINLVLLIYHPMTRDDFELIQRERKELGLPEIMNPLSE